MAIPILPADILKSKFEELFLEVLLGLHIAENFQNIQKFKKYLHRTWLEGFDAKSLSVFGCIDIEKEGI